MGKLDKYYEIREKIDLGDLFFFDGKGITSDLIKVATASKYTHVGMSLTLDIGITGSDISQERIFCIESTTLSNVKDISGEFRRGVQMVPMSQRLDAYEGRVWWVPLAEPIEEDKKQPMVNWLLATEASRIDYDTEEAIQAGIDDERWIFPFRWLAKPFSGLFKAKPDYSKLFCSEMVTRALQIGGKVPETINASEQTPIDVYNFGFFKSPVQLI